MRTTAATVADNPEKAGLGAPAIWSEQAIFLAIHPVRVKSQVRPSSATITRCPFTCVSASADRYSHRPPVRSMTNSMTDQDEVAFVATYEDGEEWFMVDRSVLQKGDSGVLAIAAERQLSGQLPPGRILMVTRMIDRPS
jgi:hypothetical protein